MLLHSKLIYRGIFFIRSEPADVSGESWPMGELRELAPHQRISEQPRSSFRLQSHRNRNRSPPGEHSRWLGNPGLEYMTPPLPV